MKKINIILCVIMMGALMSACKKDSTPEAGPTYPYAVSMTDAPGPYDSVFVEIVGVEITGGHGPVVLTNVHPGIYNLLKFSNGIDTLFATGTLTDANVSQIRLILGSNNSVVIGGVNYPLSTPSADQSGLKLQVHQTLTAGVLYSVLLDFDANKSIVDNGNGTYKLKPVIRTIETALSGSLKGKITPVGTLAFVTATSGSSSYSTNVTASGNFLLMGLPAGVYSVTITPALPLNPVTINNITVMTGMAMDLGTTNF